MHGVGGGGGGGVHVVGGGGGEGLMGIGKWSGGMDIQKHSYFDPGNSGITLFSCAQHVQIVHILNLHVQFEPYFLLYLVAKVSWYIFF